MTFVCVMNIIDNRSNISQINSYIAAMAITINSLFGATYVSAHTEVGISKMSKFECKCIAELRLNYIVNTAIAGPLFEWPSPSSSSSSSMSVSTSSSSASTAMNDNEKSSSSITLTSTVTNNSEGGGGGGDTDRHFSVVLGCADGSLQFFRWNLVTHRLDVCVHHPHSRTPSIVSRE